MSAALDSFAGGLKVPAIVAPMFLVSGPDLVVESCKAGLCGTFPALNHRTTEGFDEWLCEIEERLDDDAAPYGVNLIVHGSNPRVEADLEVCVKHKVPLVITSLGAVPDLVNAVQSYGAQMMVADYAYFGSHFIAATESMAPQGQKDMMIGASAKDVSYTDKVTGIGANFLTPSLQAATLHDAPGEMSLTEEAKAWKTIWSAGHGTGAVRDLRPTREICEQLIAEYEAARAKFCG